MDFKVPAQFELVEREVKTILESQKAYGKIHFEFDQKVTIPFVGRKVLQRKSIDLKCFISAAGTIGYTNRKNGRRGLHLTELPFSHIVKIEAVSNKPDPHKDSQRALNSIHPNAWKELVKAIEADPTYIEKHYGGFSPVSIIPKFPSYVLAEIKKAFEECKDYQYKTYGTKRDLSVDIKAFADGTVKAWFSSEYAGYANGSYYLLINPTTAAFREDD